MSPRRAVLALDRWIFSLLPSDSRSLGIYRILVGGYFVLFIAPVVRFPSFPGSFFAPPLGPLRLFTAPPPSWFFVLLSAAISVCSVALLVGYRTTAASLAAGLLGLLAYGFVYSFGKIDHNYILVFVVPIVMSASGWGNSYSVDGLRRKAPRAVETWPTSLLALLLGFMMFSAGLPKLVTGWVDPSTHAAQGFLVVNYLSGRHEFLAPYFLHLQSAALWEAVDDATVVFETGFVLAILSRTSLRLFCAVAVLFHTAILLMMNIDFTPNFVAYAAFVDWPTVLRWLRPAWVRARPSRVGLRLATCPPRLAVVLTLAAGLGLFVATYAGGDALLALSLRWLHAGQLVPALCICVPASLLAVVYLARAGWHGVRSLVRRQLAVA